MKNKKLKYTYNIIGFSVILFLALRELLSALMPLLGIASDTFIGMSLRTVIVILACLVPVVCMENLLGMHPKLFKRVKHLPLLAADGYGYMCIIVAGIVNSLFLTLLRAVGLNFAPYTLSIPESIPVAILYFISICVLPPVLEEIFLRGYILNALKPYGTAFAVVISSGIFALMHQGLENFLLYFVCGVILAEVYLAFDSIYASMLLHFTNNTMSFFMLRFQSGVNAVNALTLSMTVNVLVLMAGLWGRWYLKKHRIDLYGEDDDDGNTLKKLAEIKNCPVAVAALGLLIFFAALASFNKLI